MTHPPVTIEIDARTRVYIAQAAQWPENMMRGIARGMQKANAFVVSDIQSRRLTGKGPFPVEEHRLGIVTNRLRSSLRATAPVVSGLECTTSIGSNVKYAPLHEFGATFQRTSQPGVARLKANARGELVMRGNLATFARKGSKRFVAVPFTGGKTYKVTIPERAPVRTGIRENMPTYNRFLREEIIKAMPGGNVT
jgi:phage gpG-like protein